jgi:WD40 repeat protein
VVFAAGAGVATAYAVQADENARLAEEEQENAAESARDAREKERDALRAKAAADAARAEEERQKGIATELARQATAREARAVRERYALDANLSLVAWQAGDVERLRQFLLRYPSKAANESDPRGFEWHYLDRLSRSETEAIRLWPSSRTTGLAFFWGGDGLAYGHENDVCVYAPGRMAKPVAYRGHTNTVVSVATNPRTGDIASASLDGTVRVWDPETGNVLRTLRGDARQLHGVAITPDGRTLVSCGGNHLVGPQAPGEVVVWDWETGRPRHVLRDHRDTVTGVAISADGRVLMSCGSDGVVNCYEVETGKHLHKWQLSRSHLCIALDPRKKWFAVGSHIGPIGVYDAETGALMRELHGHGFKTGTLACSPDGSVLASGTYDGDVRVWNPHTGQLVRQFRGHVSTVTAVGFRPPSGRLVSVGIEAVARVWDLRKFQEYTVLAPKVGGATTLIPTREPAGLLNAGYSGEMTLRDPATGRPLPYDAPSEPGSYVLDTVLLPDGKTFAFVGADGAVVYRSVPGSTTPPALAAATRATPMRGVVAAAPNGRSVAILRNSRWVDVYDLTRSGGPRTVTLPAPGTALAFGPGDDPLVAAAHKADGIVLYRADGSPAGEIATGPGGKAYRLAFSPDGTTLAGADGQPRVHLWDVRSGKEVWCSEAHTATVASVAFSPRGDRLVTASHDLTARVFDTATGAETLCLRGHGRGVEQALFTPDGAAIITAGADGRILRWEGDPAR